MGWVILGDGITRLEIVALICSFGGVLLIATSGQSESSDSAGEAQDS